MRTKYRLGIDAGGTFTDLVLADQSGDVRLYKALSTPADPTRAIEEGMKLIADDLGESPAEIVANSDLCINGTTVGLNALIQHKGGKTGLICTAGHEDSIEIRLGHKEDGYRYDPEYPAAVMLVPRYLRKGVRERVRTDRSRLRCMKTTCAPPAGSSSRKGSRRWRSRLFGPFSIKTTNAARQRSFAR